MSGTSISRMGRHPRWFLMAVVYFLLAVALGVGMSASHDHRLMPVHAHLNLLGWVSMAVIGLMYDRFPAAAATRLAQAHFWLHNLALPPMMVALSALLLGVPGVEPVLAITSIATLLATALFTVAIWKHRHG